MRNPALIFKDFGDGAALAQYDGENVGMVVRNNGRGGNRFAWSFSKPPMIVYFRVAADKPSAHAALTRHFFEWLYATTTKEAAEKVGSAA